MKVGFATKVLSVQSGTLMGGYAFREGVSDGTLDSLRITAITWCDGTHRAAIALVDVICVNADLTNAVRAAVSEVDIVWLAASHTHAGPETGCLPGGTSTPASWLDRLTSGVAAVVQQAKEVEVDTHGRAYTGMLQGVGAVRSQITQEASVPLDVIEVIAEGRRAGVIVVLPVHPTVLPADNLLVSADLTGAVRRALSDRLGSGTWVAVATGAAGDISTRHTRQAQDPAELTRLGDVVADRCLELLAGPAASCWSTGSGLSWRSQMVRLQAKPPVALVPANGGVTPDPVASRIAEANLAGARFAAQLARPAADLEAEVAALRIGRLTLAALPGEPFLGPAEQLRRASPGPAVVFGYANAYPGYLPPAAAYQQATYEVVVAAVAAGSSERIIRVATDLIAGLGTKRRNMIDQNAYATVARRAIDRLITTQRDAIAQAGRLVAESLMADGVLQAYGTGHSRAVALELTGRAGGLIPANQLAIRDLVYYGDAAPAEILDPLLERSNGVADRIWRLADIRPADVFVIISNSGGNGAVVEMAQLAKTHGHRLIAITSLEHSGEAASRQSPSPRLADIADVVIDNGAPWGDAALPMPGGGATGPLSTLTGILAANLLVADVVGRLLDAGATPAVFRSANTPGGFEHNAGILLSYGERVRLGDA